MNNQIFETIQNSRKNKYVGSILAAEVWMYKNKIHKKVTKSSRVNTIYTQLSLTPIPQTDDLKIGVIQPKDAAKGETEEESLRAAIAKFLFEKTEENDIRENLIDLLNKENVR